MALENFLGIFEGIFPRHGFTASFPGASRSGGPWGRGRGTGLPLHEPGRGCEAEAPAERSERGLHQELPNIFLGFPMIFIGFIGFL